MLVAIIILELTLIFLKSFSLQFVNIGLHS